MEIPGKGKGVIVTRDIKAGELVLAEEPLLRLRKQRMGPEYMAARLASLTPNQREAFYQLHRSGAQADIPELDIVTTNGFQMGDAGDTGIFLISSRINHTCFPNISSTWQEDKGKRHFHAIKPIRKGDEIGSLRLPARYERESPETAQRSLWVRLLLHIMSNGRQSFAGE